MRKFDKPDLLEKISIIQQFTQQAEQYLKNDDLTNAKRYLKIVEHQSYIPLNEFDKPTKQEMPDPLAIEQAKKVIEEVSLFIRFARDYIHNQHEKGATHSIQAIKHIIESYLDKLK